MTTNSPLFFSDRDLVSHLDLHAHDLVEAMRKWGIGRVDKRDRINFCGLIYHHTKGAVVFLPREAKTGDPTIDLQTASFVMKALARYGTETSKRNLVNDGASGNPGVLSIVKRLTDDFRDRGLFSERVRHQTQNAGKPDWPKTVAGEIAMPSHKGQPVFMNIRTSHTTSSSDVLLAQIQAAVIREIFSKHSWWLSGTSIRRQELLCCSRPPFPRTTWASKLDALLPSLYSARSVFLAEYLRYYLRDTRRSSDGTFVFGVEDFHTVWETILRETIVRSPFDSKRNWNSELPKPFYLHQGTLTQEPRSRGMQTDIILEHGSSFTIVDAKYYAAKNAESAPGWPDIAKQIFYEKALREIVDHNTDYPVIINNVFAFPASSNHGPLTKVEIRHTNGNAVSSAFPPIACVYISVRDALRHYVLGTQGISLESNSLSAP